MSGLFNYVRGGCDEEIFVVTTIYFRVRNKEILQQLLRGRALYQGNTLLQCLILHKIGLQFYGTNLNVTVQRRPLSVHNNKKIIDKETFGPLELISHLLIYSDSYQANIYKIKSHYECHSNERQPLISKALLSSIHALPFKFFQLRSTLLLAARVMFRC